MDAASQDSMDLAEAEAIARRLSTLSFAWDIEKALEFALFRTYAVPEISGLLARTGAFETAPRKRYDDTELLLSEPMEHGLDSARGAEAIARINAIHGRFRIDNAEMLYVLSTFVLEPIRWMERYGRRSFSQAERRAWVTVYRALGARMGIRDMPGDIAGFEALNRAYEAVHFRYAETNARIGGATLDLLLGFYAPRVLVPVLRPVACCLMDRALLRAMGFPEPPGWLRRAVMDGMGARARLLRVLPKRRRPRRITERRRPTYPGGYVISELGNGPRRGSD